MTIRHITFDARDALVAGRFWAEALGWRMDEESESEEALVEDPDGRLPGLLFVAVPEPKQGKNRLHLDLSPSRPRDQEVERLAGLGARVLDDRRRPDGGGWVVMADPEGNEFCVERGEAERPVAP